MPRLSQKSREIVGIDLLRFIAAAGVMLYHFGFWYRLPGEMLARPGDGVPPSGLASFHFGWIGVEIFFVISGFVIAYSAVSATPGRFLRGRVLRLVPAAWICATVSLAIYAGIIGRPLRALLLLYVPTLLFWPFKAIDGVYWTLGVELSFYLIVYVLIRRGQVALMEAVMAAIGIGSGLFWVFVLLLLAFLAAHPATNAPHVTILVHKLIGARILQLLLVQHGCLFALGVLMHGVMRHGATRMRIGFIAMLMAACCLEIIGQNDLIARLSHIPLSPLPALGIWLAAIAFMAVAIFRNDAIVRLSGARIGMARFIGRLTYPLYLLHTPVTLGVIVVLWPLIGTPAAACGMLASIALSALVERYPEKWLRHLLGKLITGPESPPASTDRDPQTLLGRNRPPIATIDRMTMASIPSGLPAASQESNKAAT